ncbi:MAG: efflux RND transporter permease subunit [Phycisphaeraceae bacterium]|nr:efflux RND transporter permease subunit [Phycisphaeraceae bacterium]
MMGSGRLLARPRIIVLVAVLCVATGWVAITTLPKERTPRIKLPVVQVLVVNPGAGPAVNETEIIRPIEEESARLGGLRRHGRVMSQATADAALVQFIFDDQTRIEEARRDVENLVNRVRGRFPEPAQRNPGPTISEIAFEDWPIVQVFLVGGDSGDHRRRVADSLARRLEGVGGVQNVGRFGGLEPEVRVEVHPHLMAGFGLSFDDVAHALVTANDASPGGTLEPGEGFDLGVRLGGRLASLEEIEQVSFPIAGGRVVRLEDFADVHANHKPRRSIARYDSQDAVVLLIQPGRDIDVHRTAREAEEVVADFIAGGHGQNLEIGVVRSQAREIEDMLGQLGASAIYGTMLVMLLLWLAMGWRNALLVGMSVPMALLGAAALGWMAKQSFAPNLAINNMTLFGTILVIGLVVDGCIIVAENIDRHRQLGRSAFEAACRGVDEVGPSLISAYLTTFAAFAPMFLIRGVMGDYLELLPLVVMLALIAASMTDHYLLPMLTMYLGRSRAQGKERERLEEQIDPELTPEVIEIRDARRFVERSRAARIYGRAMTLALRHRFMVLGMALVLMLIPLGLFGMGAIGMEFFPETDVPIIEVDFDLPLGSSLEQRTIAAAGVLEAAVMRAVRHEEWHQPIGGGPRLRPVTTLGDPAALSTNLDFESGTGPEFGKIYIELELAEHRRRSASEIRRAIRAEIQHRMRSDANLAGLRYRVHSPSEGPPAGSALLVRVLGQDETTLDTLARRAEAIEEALRRVPGVTGISNDFRVRPQLRAAPDVAVSGLYGVTRRQLGTSVAYLLEGVRVGEVDFGGDEMRDLRLRAAPEFRRTLEDIQIMPIRAQSGAVVTFGDVAQLHRTEEADIIRRYDRRRVINIRADLNEGVLADAVRLALLEQLDPGAAAAMSRTPGRAGRILHSDSEVIVEFGGETEVRDDAVADLQMALLLAMGAMLLVLTLHFNRFLQPLIVLLSVPLSLVGVFLGLMICGMAFSVAALIGVVALAGIVVNDSIVLVSFINRMRAMGLTIEEAVIRAGQLRLRAITLTTMTTIGGLLPLSLNISGGGEFWQPLTITMMFGLAAATVLELLVIPLLCYMTDRAPAAPQSQSSHTVAPIEHAQAA